MFVRITMIAGFSNLIKMCVICSTVKTDLYCSMSVALINKHGRERNPKLYIQSKICTCMFELKTYNVEKFFNKTKHVSLTL